MNDHQPQGVTLYGPHCHHHDLCSMFGCDQRGHIDFPCRDTATCWFCGPGALCPMDPDVLAVDCAECGVDAPKPQQEVAHG